MRLLFSFFGLAEKLIYDPQHKMIEQLRKAINDLEMGNWLSDDDLPSLDNPIKSVYK